MAMLVHTKGKLIKDLHEVGVRYADKNGSNVQLEHLKYCDVVKLWADKCGK